MTAATDITFVLTSCGRFDLLAETISTFAACHTAPSAAGRRWRYRHPTPATPPACGSGLRYKHCHGKGR